jgi:phosphoglycolate phosphatase-like HAD superfamily hydrolase
MLSKTSGSYAGRVSGDRPLAVFDVDGVLADVRHRLHHLSATPKRWNRFFAEAPADPPLTTGITLARESALECEVMYLTGRPEQCREDTLAWFEAHGLPLGRLTMRGVRDRRPARVTKPETLSRLAEGRTVALVVDDDEQVCDAYEAAGWRVLRARWMTQSPELHDAQELQGRT